MTTQRPAASSSTTLMTLDPKASIAFYTHSLAGRRSPSNGSYTMSSAARTDGRRRRSCPPRSGRWAARRTGCPTCRSPTSRQRWPRSVTRRTRPHGRATSRRSGAAPSLGSAGSERQRLQPGRPSRSHDTTKRGEVCWNELAHGRSRIGVRLLREALRLEEVARLRHGRDGQVPHLRKGGTRSAACSPSPRTCPRRRIGSTTSRWATSTRPSSAPRRGARSS